METPQKIPSDQSFCITFAIVFGLLGAWLLWKSSDLGIPALCASGAFAVIAAVAPQVLHRLNLAWMRLGMLLNMIVSPIVMGLIYFAVFTPVALFFRIKGRDSLRRKFEPDVPSYWIDRQPPGPDGSTLPRQF